MAVNLYTGTPGSGKSLDVARMVGMELRAGRNVIGTMIINPAMVSKYRGKYIYVDIYSLNPGDLIAYARKYHVKGKENQCLLVVDECQTIFNSRDWGAKGRAAWNRFFQVHRHFGYNVALITQYDRLIDRQLRALVENQYIHRKVANFGTMGKALSLLFGGGLFIKVCEWYPIHEKIGSEFYVYRKKYGNMYDSYSEFDEQEEGFNGLLPYIVPSDQTEGVESGEPGALRTTPSDCSEGESTIT